MLLCGDFSSLPGGDLRRGSAPSNQEPSTSSAAAANAAAGNATVAAVAEAPAAPAAGKQRVGGVLLDIGAGDGSVTAQLATLFDSVVATEARCPPACRLHSRYSLSLRLSISRVLRCQPP